MKAEVRGLRRAGAEPLHPLSFSGEQMESVTGCAPIADILAIGHIPWMHKSAVDLLDVKLIQKAVKDLARQLGQEGFSIASTPQGDGSPYVEVSFMYFFVIEERGVELDRRGTLEIDQIFYWIMKELTFSMATRHELHKRREAEDCRRQIFAKQIELLSHLSFDWAERCKCEQMEILARHPFQDG